ncbi:hypothetical protein VIGAN_04053200 [Vigna angularis var. angularis]|uniref:Uncharacterized protein n=1 Tax=Vigna angularis var. angularis TaxID=157739 RepID=A0A0S3RS19_PHAAN|nr:hypothetical protein VIGAN_04053200 [Vigna angularis var. angularis]
MESGMEPEKGVGSEGEGEILLGPSAIGRNEKFLNTIFPKKSLTALETVAHLGLLFFLFLVGVALSITAFSVLTRILAELKLLTIDAGRITMAVKKKVGEPQQQDSAEVKPRATGRVFAMSAEEATKPDVVEKA